MMEYGLAGSKDTNDVATKLESLREIWENLCPGFHKWFASKRKAIFQNSVIGCTRKMPMPMVYFITTAFNASITYTASSKFSMRQIF